MPKFLSREEVYRILQRELPPNVYPDGAPSGFYSTADMDSVADVAATGYANLERIYDNIFPQSADERLNDWEITAFGKLLEANLSLEERRDRVITKIRARKGITKRDMEEAVLSIIGSDKLMEIIEWGCRDGGWQLDESQLDINTFLNGQNLVDVTGSMICEADPSEYGKTEEEWLEMREDAYTYEVRIYLYTLTAAERQAIDEALSAAEPARSKHVITDGLNPNDIINPDAFEFILGTEEGEQIGLEEGGVLEIDF